MGRSSWETEAADSVDEALMSEETSMVPGTRVLRGLGGAQPLGRVETQEEEYSGMFWNVLECSRMF